MSSGEEGSLSLLDLPQGVIENIFLLHIKHSWHGIRFDVCCQQLYMQVPRITKYTTMNEHVRL